MYALIRDGQRTLHGPSVFRPTARAGGLPLVAADKGRISSSNALATCNTSSDREPSYGEWKHLDHKASGMRLHSSSSEAWLVRLTSATNTGDNVRWKLTVVPLGS